MGDEVAIGALAVEAAAGVVAVVLLMPFSVALVVAGPGAPLPPTSAENGAFQTVEP